VRTKQIPSASCSRRGHRRLLRPAADRCLIVGGSRIGLVVAQALYSTLVSLSKALTDRMLGPDLATQHSFDYVQISAPANRYVSNCRWAELRKTTKNVVFVLFHRLK